MGKPTDPRKAGGGMVDPIGNPHGRHTVVFDLGNAVLLGGIDVSLVETQRGGESQGVRLAMQLEGRINKTKEQATILYLFDEDGAAAIITQLIGLAGRIGPEFQKRLMARLQEMADEGTLSR